MIDMNELVQCVRAIELLHYGVDITKLDTLKQYWNIKEKKLQSRLSDNIGDFICQIDDDVANFIEWPLGKFFERRGQEFSAIVDETEPINCTVDLDTFKKVMTILKMKQWCRFGSVPVEKYDAEYEARMKKMKEEWNYHDTSEASMVQELSHDAVQDNLHCLLTLCGYGKEATKAILEQYDNSPKSFEIDALKDYKVIDNRIYIKIPQFDRDFIDRDTSDLKYLVISRNVYDYFFCSYGSEIQSCYSLTSSHYGFYGMVALSACKGNFIVYLTTGKPNKINLINGVKWSVPRMFTRSWAWLGEDGKLYLDRSYTGSSWSSYERDLRKLIYSYLDNSDLTYKLPQPLKYATDMVKWHSEHRFRFYPDSIKVADFKFYGVCAGDRTFVGRGEPFDTTMFNKLQAVNSVPKDFKYVSRYQIVDGVISPLRICPITNLPLRADETISKYAKYFKEPVKRLAVLTYCDGWFKADCSSVDERVYDDGLTIDPKYTGACSRKDGITYKFFKNWTTTCYNPIPIKSFKESITGLVRNSSWDAVLVRYIEDDRVTYVKYRGKK